MQKLGEVIGAYTAIGLRSEIVAFLKGIDYHVDQRVDHEDPQKEDRGQQIQPPFQVIVFHLCPALLFFEINAFFTLTVKQMDLERFDAEIDSIL